MDREVRCWLEGISSQLAVCDGRYVIQQYPPSPTYNTDMATVHVGSLICRHTVLMTGSSVDIMRLGSGELSRNPASNF